MLDTLKNNVGTTVAFGDVIQLSKASSKDPVADGFERYVGLEHLEPSDLKVRSWGNIADGITFTKVFKPGQVLFGKRRAYQRKVAVAGFSGVCSGDIYVLEPKGDELLPELLPFICQSESFYDYVISMSQGGLSPRVNWKALAKYEFALPPLKEQRRITEVLQASEGSIRRHHDISEKAFKLWRSLSYRELGERAGEGGRLDVHYTITSGQVDPRDPRYARLPLIAPNHIEPGRGRITELVSAETQAAISGKYLYEKGVVLYSKIRPELRKAAIAPCQGLCSADMYSLIPNEDLRATYLLEILLSDAFSRFAISGSMRTGMPKVNRQHLAALRFDLPSPSEQDKYLRQVQAIHTAIDDSSKRRQSLMDFKRTAMFQMGVA